MRAVPRRQRTWVAESGLFVSAACRVTINRYGRFSYAHQPDASWDVSEWLLETRNQLTTWSDVYWTVWGTVSYLECARCLDTFPATEFANCRYHPDAAVFEPNRLAGEHPCCGLRVHRFDPLQPNKVLSVAASRPHLIHGVRVDMERKFAENYDE